ncbi:MAG: hypothetical protein ACXVJT_05715 [Thermoanaerobaculia bacterium]
MRRWSFLPWLCGALLLVGPVASPPNALIFYRSMLLVAVLIATAAAVGAARAFDRGDQLFITWAVLASAYALLTIRYVMRLLVTVHVMELPVTFDRVLLIAHNIGVPVALWLFVRSWRTTGLAGPMSRAGVLGWTLAGFAVALAIGGFPLMRGLHNTDPAVLVSTLGDMVSIALIVPLLMPALGLRGGLLMYTWLYLALAQVAWLMYDIWAVARLSVGVSTAWGLAIDQGLRAVALLYVYSAAAAQRRALAPTRSTEPHVEPRPVVSKSTM